MTLSTHTAIGAAIGFSLGSPLVGFILGFLSHLLIDMIPHGDSHISENLRVHKKKKGALTYGTIDGVIAIYLILLVSSFANGQTQMVLSAAIAGSVLPDLFVGLYDITKSRLLKPFNDLHFYFHDFLVGRYGDIKLSASVLTQGIFIFLLLRIF